MTPEQQDKLNRFLVERVMGWEFHEGTRHFKSTYRTKDGLVTEQSFNPMGNFEQCEPLLDKIEKDGWGWSARKVKRTDGGQYYEFALTKTIDAHLIIARSESRTEALRLAIAKAYGWEEEA